MGGRDTSSLRAALTITDILVVPVLRASLDLWALEPLQDLIIGAREINTDLPVVTLLSAADAQGRDNGVRTRQGAKQEFESRAQGAEVARRECPTEMGMNGKMWTRTVDPGGLNRSEVVGNPSSQECHFRNAVGRNSPLARASRNLV